MTWLFILPFLIPLASSAQEMKVKSMTFVENDLTASLSDNLHKDPNGEYGGLVKVLLANENAEFEGLVLNSTLHAISEYWVFMAKGSRVLKVRVPGYLPLDVNFRDYGIDGIKSRCTYVLIITLPQTGQVLQDDGMRYLAMSITPKNSTVLIDGKLQMVDQDGELAVRLPKGAHRYQVSAVGYATKEGTVEVGDNLSPLSVSLVSTQATLRVECATEGAVIFINDRQKGVAPWSGMLPPGSYLVEARLDGYPSQKQNVILKEKESQTMKFPPFK